MKGGSGSRFGHEASLLADARHWWGPENHRALKGHQPPINLTCWSVSVNDGGNLEAICKRREKAGIIEDCILRVCRDVVEFTANWSTGFVSGSSALVVSSIRSD